MKSIFLFKTSNRRKESRVKTQIITFSSRLTRSFSTSKIHQVLQKQETVRNKCCLSTWHHTKGLWSVLNSPGVTLWWLHQRFHQTPDHSSHGSPRSDRQNKPDASEMNLKSESKHTPVHIASYHAENGVRAAAALVHFRLSIMPVFCMNQVTIT